MAREVVQGIREKRLYIFPNRAGRSEVEGRHERLMAGFDQALMTSPPLSPHRPPMPTSSPRRTPVAGSDDAESAALSSVEDPEP